MAIEHWVQLSLTPGLGPILLRRLIEATGSVENACAANASLLREIEGIGSAKASKIAQGLKEARAETDDVLSRSESIGAAVIGLDDDVYPAMLRSIPDPPAVLYMRGQLQPRDLHALAIVGSRKCSYYGREQAERFAAILSAAGMTVISGGARGIDSAAHRGAISHPEGRTIAVLGCGVDVAYPPENDKLFEQIAGGRGAVLSEYPPGAPPVAENFPRRNRIVSGMSRGVLVIEADVRSGALITARQANEEQGRTVFALPGRVDNALSVGPHQLIRDGAILVTQLSDILDDLTPFPEDVIQPAPTTRQDAPLVELRLLSMEKPSIENLSQRQQLVVGHLEKSPTSIDALMDRTQLPAHVILQELTFLTLKGLVTRIDGQSFALRSGA
jgi:DNA processing protein